MNAPCAGSEKVEEEKATLVSSTRFPVDCFVHSVDSVEE
jgi:hypothetical protein